ncbi:MAG: zinc-ribbon domain-containing protein [Ignavibacteria bacterium]|nr:zinc-ribbon domain-containing protein [Ignavibacteria bacterium]
MLIGILIGVIFTGIAHSIKSFLWNNDIPKFVEKTRWVLAFILLFGINTAGVLLKINTNISAIAAAILAGEIGFNFKNSKPKNDNTELNDIDDYSCSECGKNVNQNDKFCPNCGANLGEVIDEPVDEIH